jgi:NAD(P)-dependent dehydrogenase (short-subunit alcohol dehydrogenase family)
MNELRFDGRVVLVTGSGRGLGSAYAKLFAARGASVVVNDPGASLGGEGSDHGPAQQVAGEINHAGGKAVANFDSVATEDGARATVAQALAAFGRIDVVVNNAGNFTSRYPLEETSTESFERIWRVHVLGSVNVIRAAWPHMKARRYGRIVNIASHAGYLGFRGNIEYCTAKGAVHGMTRAVALEAIDHGISVNAVAPFGMTRPLLSFFGGSDAPQGGAFAAALSAPAVIWLAHEDCPANGEILGTIAGTTTRIKMAETKGHFSKSPTPESIRDNFETILDQESIDSSGLTFGVDGESRGMELVGRYNGTEVTSFSKR